VGFKTGGDLEHIQSDVALCLFRIAQEALRNGAVYGEARRLEVSIARSADHIELTVTDDGRGFDLEAVRRDGSGLGLVSMEERAHVVGGDLQIITRPGQGTTILVRIPAGACTGAEKSHVHEPMHQLAAHAPQR
jgi:two-component system sensor histidine kinase UhpB